jgi:hypothetical protein
MTDFLKTLTDMSIENILVIAGILFLLMSVAEKISGHLTIPETRKKQALIIGLALLAVGVALFVLPLLLPLLKSPEVEESLQPTPTTQEPVGSTTSLACYWDRKFWAKMKQWSHIICERPCIMRAKADLILFTKL